MNYKIRAYTKADESELLKVFDSNIPDFFAPEEKSEFLAFLDEGIKTQEVYEVLEIEGALVAAGGYRKEKEGDARICWLMVDKHLHQKGWGRILLEKQMEQIKNSGKYQQISLMTSQHTDKFYEKLGFYRTRFEANYWAEGMDLIMMEMNLEER